MTEWNFETFETHTEQSVDSPFSTLTPAVQQQVAFGGIALGTMICMAMLIREVRLLVQACKD